MRSFIRLVVFGAVAAALVTSTAAEAKLKRITIGSNPSGSVFFLLASAFSKLYQEKLGIRSTAQPHAGSTVYVPLMDAGEITLGMNNSMDSGAAYRGDKPFRKKLSNVKAIARVWVIPYAFMVKADSGIKTVQELRGKKVVVNQSTIFSLTQLNRTILATGGLKESDVTSMSSGGIVKNIDLVVQGRAVAAPVAIGMPAVRKANATVPGGIRLLPLGPQASDDFMDRGIPGARTFLAKPGKTRPFVKADTRIAAFDSYLNAGKQVSEEDAYALAKTLYDNWKALQKAYAPLRGVAQDKIAPSANPHPYHPGAVRFYKEVGLWSAANEKRQSSVQ